MEFEDFDSYGTVIYAITKPEYIADVNWIMEGYEHLALVSTVDNRTGRIKFYTTPDTYAAVIDIINHMPFQVQVVESINQKC